jgi:hypothetical protein
LSYRDDSTASDATDLATRRILGTKCHVLERNI